MLYIESYILTLSFVHIWHVSDSALKWSLHQILTIHVINHVTDPLDLVHIRSFSS